MVDLGSNNYSRCVKSIPNVKFSSIDFRMAMSNLFDTKRDISEYIGLVFLRLGFRAEDNIRLFDYDSSNYSFSCIANDNDFYNIKFVNLGTNTGNMEIVVSKFNQEFGYECILNELSEIGMKVSLSRHQVSYPDGKVYTRYLSETSAKFKIEVGDYSLEFGLGVPEDEHLPMFDKDGKYAKYRLGNEEELFSYLGGIVFPASIIQIYKEISSQFIGDVSRYPSFSLKISKLDNGTSKVIDMIDLKKGNLDRIGITERGVTVFLDKDDNWSFELPSVKSMPVCFSLSNHGGKINCVFSAFDSVNLKQYTSEIIQSDISVAFTEIEEAKKRVRSIFDENKK